MAYKYLISPDNRVYKVSQSTVIKYDGVALQEITESEYNTKFAEQQIADEQARAAELAQAEQDAQAAAQAAAERQVRIDAARVKLVNLGLTEEEADALAV